MIGFTTAIHKKNSKTEKTEVSMNEKIPKHVSFYRHRFQIYAAKAKKR